MDILDQIPTNQPSKNDYQMAMWAHLIGLATSISSFIGLIGIIVFYFVNRDRHEFVRSHAQQALNFQITYFLVGLVVTFVFVGTMFTSVLNTANEPTPDPNTFLGIFAGAGVSVILWIALWITNIVIAIIGATKANRGEWWKNPIAIQFIR